MENMNNAAKAGPLRSIGEKGKTEQATVGGSCTSAAITMQPITGQEQVVLLVDSTWSLTQPGNSGNEKFENPVLRVTKEMPSYTRCKELAKRSIVNELSPKKGLCCFPYIGNKNYKYVGGAVCCLITTPLGISYATLKGLALPARIIIPTLNVCLWPYNGYMTGDCFGDCRESSPFSRDWFAKLVSEDTVKSCLKPVPGEEDIHRIQSSLAVLEDKSWYHLAETANQLANSLSPQCCGIVTVSQCELDELKKSSKENILRAVAYLDQALECAKERSSSQATDYYVNSNTVDSFSWTQPLWNKACAVITGIYRKSGAAQSYKKYPVTLQPPELLRKNCPNYCDRAFYGSFP